MRKKVYLFIKRIMDIIVSAIMLVVLSPLLLILVILVTAENEGSPIYKQERVGRGGRRINIYKFRSMKKNAENFDDFLTKEQIEKYNTEFKINDDPRITRMGRFIRKTSLDELPQLINILKGDMSLVGPRPVVEKELAMYGENVEKFLSVTPGLTGYWQAYARNDATYESGERQKMEIYYVDNQSFWFDIKIIFKTIGAVFKCKGM